MSVTIDINGEVLIALLEGEIDDHNAKFIREEIDSAVARNAPELMILDFRDVSFMDSSGIGLVMGRYKNTRYLGTEIHVTNTSPQIKKVMQLSGLGRLVKLDKLPEASKNDKIKGKELAAKESE